MKNNNRKNKYIGCLLIILFTFLLAGCGYTKEEKELMATYEKNAKNNAVNYIEAKYGFSADIVKTNVLKVDPGPVPDFTPSPSGRVNITMKYKDKEFTVNISGEENVIDGKDDYQKDEIVEDFKKTLSKELTIEIESIDVQYLDNNLLEEKYTDINSFLREQENRFIVGVVVKTLNDISEKTVEKITYDNVELLVVSSENQDDLDVLSGFKYLNEQGYKQNFYRIDYMNRKLSEYAFFMKGHVFRSKEGDVSCVLYNKIRVDDNVYYVYDNQIEAGSVSVAETSNMAPAEDWSKASGKVETFPTFIDPKKVSKSYAVDFGNLPELRIFIKKDNKNSSGKEERYAALEYIDNNGKEIYTHIGTQTVEDYYSFTLEKYDDMRFALMINQK